MRAVCVAFGSRFLRAPADTGWNFRGEDPWYCVMARAALNLFLFLFVVVGPCAASFSDVHHSDPCLTPSLPCLTCAALFQGLPEIAVASGLAAQLQMIYPSEPGLAVDKAVADGFAQALGDESMDVNEVRGGPLLRRLRLAAS
jgi:hypothetical protein